MSSPIDQDSTPVQNPVPHDDIRPKGVSYEEHKAQNLPLHLPNHYKGGEGYGNYGYLNVNDYWVDPESKKEIYDAENQLLGADHAPQLPIGTEPIPGLTEDQIYTAFVEEVSVGINGDHEGDPRCMYITPAIFSRWAIGASLGDRYVVPKIEAPVSCSLHDNFHARGQCFEFTEEFELKI